MITLFDYLPSQNGYKIRLLMNQLGRAYATEYVSIFEGKGQNAWYRSINPTGAVPAIRLEDGRVLAESNAILMYLADGTEFFGGDAFERAKIAQWLSFEADYVQSTIGSLRYWTLTGKLPRRPQALIEMKRGGAMKALGILDDELSRREFIAGDSYTIADISVFAYSHLAEDIGISLNAYPNFVSWTNRIRAQPGFIQKIYLYSIDPHSHAELP
jgi:glutathione S-transferase